MFGPYSHFNDLWINITYTHLLCKNRDVLCEIGCGNRHTHTHTDKVHNNKKGQ